MMIDLAEVQRLLALAVKSYQRGDLTDANQMSQQILAVVPAHIEALQMAGLCAAQSGKLQQAQNVFEQILAIDPNNVPAWSNLGNVQLAMGRQTEALESYRKARVTDPKYPDAIYNEALLLLDLKEFDFAIQAFNDFLSLHPGFAPAYFKLGLAHERLGQHGQALQNFDRAISLGFVNVDLLIERGNSLRSLRRLTEAIESYDRAIGINPRSIAAHRNRGVVLHDLEDFEAAVASYAQAIAVDRYHAPSMASRALALQRLGRLPEAIKDYERLIDLAPKTPFALGRLVHAKMLACDWSNWSGLIEALGRGVEEGQPVAEPFGYQAISSSEHALLLCAQSYSQRMYPEIRLTDHFEGNKEHSPTSEQGPTDRKIRIGYVCGEFRQQATSVLMTQVYESHDKSRFQLFAFDNGWDDGSPMRKRINAAMSEVVDISKLGDQDAANAIRSRGVDILVNLNGFFGLSRTALFAQRAAPVQVNYLGFPGTMGCRYMDYLIADAVVVPESSRQYYSEAIAYLPGCYQPNDGRREISSRQFSRAELGLPQHGFVFCCFNNNYKITPEMFDCWMRILESTDGSVLWLLQDNEHAASNLKHQATVRGIHPDRLVFAPRMPLPEHLARHRLADLFLDTLPYNAHTTASDALWAGLPLLTCLGTTFPGRVAASLLTAVGLDALIVNSLTQYQEKAIALASSPALLARYREHLAEHRSTSPLFDAARFTKALEQVFGVMRQRVLSGERPSAIRIKP